MPEPLDPRRLAAERSWVAAYPALVTSGVLASGLIALSSPLLVGPPRGVGLRVVLPALVLLASVGFARGQRWAGYVVLAWAGIGMIVDIFTRDLAMAAFGAVIVYVLYRVRPDVTAVTSPGSLRWVIPAALVGLIDVVLPLTLGAVTPTRVEDVARVTSSIAADLHLAHAWTDGAVRLTRRGELLVLSGVELVREHEVAIDPGRRALLVGDAVFRGEPLAASSGQVGLSFTRRFGRVRGRVVVLRTAADALQVSFEGLEVDCRRLSARFVLRRERPAPALPEAPERE